MDDSLELQNTNGGLLNTLSYQCARYKNCIRLQSLALVVVLVGTAGYAHTSNQWYAVMAPMAMLFLTTGLVYGEIWHVMIEGHINKLLRCTMEAEDGPDRDAYLGMLHLSANSCLIAASAGHNFALYVSNMSAITGKLANYSEYMRPYAIRYMGEMFRISGKLTAFMECAIFQSWWICMIMLVLNGLSALYQGYFFVSIALLVSLYPIYQNRGYFREISEGYLAVLDFLRDPEANHKALSEHVDRYYHK